VKTNPWPVRVVICAVIFAYVGCRVHKWAEPAVYLPPEPKAASGYEPAVTTWLPEGVEPGGVK